MNGTFDCIKSFDARLSDDSRRNGGYALFFEGGKQSAVALFNVAGYGDALDCKRTHGVGRDISVAKTGHKNALGRYSSKQRQRRLCELVRKKGNEPRIDRVGQVENVAEAEGDVGSDGLADHPFARLGKNLYRGDSYPVMLFFGETYAFGLALLLKGRTFGGKVGSDVVIVAHITLSFCDENKFGYFV